MLKNFHVAKSDLLVGSDYNCLPRSKIGVAAALLLSASAANAEIVFQDVTQAAGFPDTGSETWGAAWGDVDSDYYPDIFSTNHRTRATLFRNNADGTFTDISNSVDVSGTPGWTGGRSDVDTHGAVWGDLDNDGDDDLYMTISSDDDVLFINDGGLLTDRSSEWEVDLFNHDAGRMSLFVDYTGDGKLDMLAVGLTNPALYPQLADGSFGYNRNENLESYSTSQELVHILIDKVARGGNLLLNVGPTADGRIPVIQQQRLKDMGDWLKVNGEAIYKTTLWEKADEAKQDNVFYTKKGNDLFVICTKFPEKPVTVNGIKSGKVSMLGFNGKVSAKSTGMGLTISPPAITPANNPCDYAWVFKVESMK